MSQSDELERMTWTCDTCHATGRVEVELDGAAILSVIGDSHRAASPDCGPFPTNVIVLLSRSPQ